MLNMDDYSLHEHALKERGLTMCHVGETRNVPADIYYKTYGEQHAQKVVLVMGFMGRADKYVHTFKKKITN